MIRFLQTPGPLKKIILGGLLLVICAAMVVTLVPWGNGSNFGFGGPAKGVVATVGGETVTATRCSAQRSGFWNNRCHRVHPRRPPCCCRTSPPRPHKS